MDDIEHIAGVIRSLLKLLVDNPDLLTLSVATAANGEYHFRVTVGEGDAGKLIGRVGRTARSIRTILAAMSLRRGKRIRIEFVSGDRHPL